MTAAAATRPAWLATPARPARSATAAGSPWWAVYRPARRAGRRGTCTTAARRVTCTTSAGTPGWCSTWVPQWRRSPPTWVSPRSSRRRKADVPEGIHRLGGAKEVSQADCCPSCVCRQAVAYRALAGLSLPNLRPQAVGSGTGARCLTYH